MMKNDRNSRKTAVLQSEKGLSRNHFRLILILIAIIVIALIAHGILRPDRNASLKIIYTGNMKGQIVGTEEYAGYARVASLAKEAASDGSHVLLLDAGNCLGGSIHAEVDEGQSMVSIMSTAGYDALVPGPLDFIYGSDVLSSLRSKASFPFLAANIMKSDGSTLLENYKILTINSVRIGIIGVTTGLDPSQAATESLTIADPVETVRTLIGQMSGRTDAVIVLAYTGDESVASALADISGVSLVIESGSSEANTDTRESGAIVVSAGERGSVIGIASLDITRSGSSITNTFYKSTDFAQVSDDKAAAEAVSSAAKSVSEGESLQLGSITITESSDTSAEGTFSDKLSEDASDNTSESTADSPADGTESFTGHNTETETGNFVADAMLNAASGDQASLAIIPDKDIAGTLVTGPVTRGQIDALFDTHLYLVTCKMTGGELRTVLEASFENYPQADNFLQVSGVTYTFNSSTSIGSRLSDIMVEGHTLDDARTYVVAMPDTLASQLGYTSESTGKISSGKTIASIVSEYIQKQQKLNIQTDASESADGSESDTAEESDSESGTARITIVE